MKGIYSSSVNESTVDESPFAYKDKDEIIRYIEEVADIKYILKPVYVLKDSSPVYNYTFDFIENNNMEI